EDNPSTEPHLTVCSVSEAEYEHERLVDGSQLVCLEPPCRSTEPCRVDNGRLLDEHARLLACERDCRPKACSAGARRGGRHEQRAQVEELVGLHDDRVAGASLLVPARAPRRREPEDLPANHLSPSRVVRAGRAVRERPASRRDRARPPRACAPRHGQLIGAGAARSAMRTASESLSSPARTTSRAAAAASSRRTCKERATAES